MTPPKVAPGGTDLIKLMGSFPQFALRCARAGMVLAAAIVLGSVASAQQQQLITPNFRDAEITTVIEAVQMATGRTIIPDPRVRTQVTMISSTPMTPEAFYEAFLSILEVHNFVAIDQGNVVKIIPNANTRFYPTETLPNRVSSTSDKIITQVIPVKNVSAAQLLPALRPLVPNFAHMTVFAPSNIIIISDRAANVDRIMRIVERIDRAGDSEVEVIPLQNASAGDLVRVVTSLYQAQGQGEGATGPSPLRLVADERTNSVLISGDPGARLRVKALIAHLDPPLESGGETQVRYLRYADAEKIAAKLKEQVTGITQTAPGQGGQGAPPPSAQAERNTTIWADPDTNALVITAPPKIMKSLMSVVDQLDIRRLQVLIEAIVVDVSLNKSAELGVNWAVFSDDDDTRIPGATFLGDVGGVNLIELGRAVDDPSQFPPELASGTTIGLGRIARDGGVSFAAMLRALRNDDNTNIIVTPHTVTMDNQEAEIKVAQEVPFRTGQFTNTGGTNGSVNPFTTISREEVGTIMKITPQINLGDTLTLKIELESSSVAPTQLENAADLITNKRTITTNVLIEDGGIIVLGGLIQDNYSRGESRVPYLGRIPLLGNLFKTRTGQSRKSNLMVFLRPKILRDAEDTAIVTNAKYQYIREEQRKTGKRELLPILPGERPPVLPPPPPVPAPSSDEDPRTQSATKPETEEKPAGQTQGAEQPPPAAQPPAEQTEQR